MILADTSAWVEYDRATDSTADRRLTELIAADGPLAVTQPTVMELLAGARTDSHQDQLRRLLMRFHLYPFDSASDFQAAALIYRRCRRAGVTPRGLIDCLVAAVAWRVGATLLSHDADLAGIAEAVGIEIDPASLRP